MENLSVQADIGIVDYFMASEYSEDQQTIPNAWKVNTIVNRLKEATSFFSYSGLGTGVLSLGFYAVAIQPAAIYLVITSVAFEAISYLLSSRVNAHLISFPENKRAEFALARFKEQLKVWPSFESKEALNVHLGGNPIFGYAEIMERVKHVNVLYPLIDLFYNPSEDPFPQVRINSSALNDHEKKEILLYAFSEGVVLHLSYLEATKPGGRNSPFEAYVEDCKAATENIDSLSILKIFEDSQKMSCDFFDEIKKKCLATGTKFPLDHITRQLEALAPKLFVGMHGYAFRPLVIMKDDDLSKIPIKTYFSENYAEFLQNPRVQVKNPMSTYDQFTYWVSGY
jgi:hypothetical protein